MFRWKYDVFVSFRGEDIRKSFIDHLFKDFKQNGIHAFRDNIELPRGEEISQLYKAIEQSRFLMVIFSKNYASSSWCLRELVKILNSNQMEKPKHEIRILFYDVKPEVVRKQTESYAEAFAKHEVSNRAEVDEWKEALSMAANLSGWDLKDTTNGYESKFIDRISKDIHKTLCDVPLHVGENLVGVDDRVSKLNLVRFIGSSKVNMIGICGISGIGKTTLAKAIYNSMYALYWFKGSCFCEDVQGVTKRQGLPQVQKQLINKIMKNEDVKISHISEGIMVIKKRVACEPMLLVLDDVDHLEQLEALAGSHNWFCPGSLIIFTGKDKQLLRSHGVDEIYEMEFLDGCEDITLFCLYAFRQTYPIHDFKDLACQVVKYLQGHPLALKVVGSALFEKPVRIWRSQLDTLQMYLNSEILQKLRPSFDMLDIYQKRIFLDIACSLIGENIDLSSSVLSVNCSADANIDVLVDKSLISISPDFSLQMHELIRSMAREVLREESDRPSRLWDPSDVYDVLNENNVTITKAVEVLVLSLEKSTKKVHIDSKAFANMKKLRILKVYYPEPEDSGEPFELKISTDFNVNLSGSLDFLSNELRLIYWHGYPFKFLPSNFYPENVVAIDLSYSNIKSFWTTPKCFKRLKVMKLRHCRNLITTPDFTEMTNLEKLILEGCVNLVKLHPSIGMLKKLVTLNMRDCIQIRSFRFKVEMDNQLTQVSGTLKTLVKLWFPCIWWTSIFQKQPQSLVLPSLASLRLLTELNIRNCNISEVCPDIGALSCLTILNLSDNNFTNLPGSLSQLSRLKELCLNGCKKLEVLPELPPSIETLQASGCTSLQEPPRLIHQRRHIYCSFMDCPKMFGNVTSIDSQVCISQTRLIDSATTSDASTNQISLLVEYLGIQSEISEFFCGRGWLLSPYKILEIILHGNRIPEWFTNKSMGGHVKVELPPYWCYPEFRGYAFCVVFTLKESYRNKRYLGGPGYSVNNFTGDWIDGVPWFSSLEDEVDRLRIHDDTMIWLFLKTCNYEWKEAKNFVTFSFGDDNEDIVEVKECGVRLFYDEDLQEEEEEEDTVLSMIQHLPTQTHHIGVFELSASDGFIHFSW